MAERWLALAITCLVTLCLILFWIVVAKAHDHERPELDSWFMQLKSGKGLCCDADEALHLKDVQWETQDKPNSHYRVKIPVSGDAYQRARHGEEVETMWEDVPDEAVVDEPNKVGAALVWPLYGYMGASIRCFMPGAMI